MDPDDEDVYEYSVRLVLYVQRRGRDTTGHRHHITKSLRKQVQLLGNRKQPYVVDVCEIRQAILVKEGKRRWAADHTPASRRA